MVDPPAEPGSRRAGQDRVDLVETGLARVVQMDVDGPVVALGQGEDGVERSVAVAVDADRIEAADEVRPHPHGLVEILRHRRAAQDAALRERDDLDLHAVRPPRPQVEDLGEVIEARDVVDVDMGPQAGRAAAEHAFEERLGALLGQREPACAAEGLLVLDDRADRAPSPVRPPAQAEHAFVEMDVPVRQARQHQGSGEIEGPRGARQGLAGLTRVPERGHPPGLDVDREGATVGGGRVEEAQVARAPGVGPDLAITPILLPSRTRRSAARTRRICAAAFRAGGRLIRTTALPTRLTSSICWTRKCATSARAISPLRHDEGSSRTR